MRYITTDKHPELKEGLILELSDNKSCILYTNIGFYLEIGIVEGLENGYIKEVEEKEFTKSDMINYGEWFYCYDEDVKEQETFDLWLTLNKRK